MSGEMMLFPDTVDEFMEQYKVVDREHTLSNGAEFVPIFRMRQWFEHLQAQPTTNADRIRAMTDEELAELIAKWAFCDECVELFGYKVCETTNCSDHWLSWLKSPVEVDE